VGLRRTLRFVHSFSDLGKNGVRMPTKIRVIASLVNTGVFKIKRDLWMRRTKYSVLTCLQQTPPKRYSDARPDYWGLSWRSTVKRRDQPASTPGQRLRQMDTSHPTCRWVQLCVDTNTVRRGGPVSFPSRLLWGLWVEKLHWDTSPHLWVLRFSPPVHTILPMPCISFVYCWH
jgi:hypothetical protein